MGTFLKAILATILLAATPSLAPATESRCISFSGSVPMNVGSAIDAYLAADPNAREVPCAGNSTQPIAATESNANPTVNIDLPGWTVTENSRIQSTGGHSMWLFDHASAPQVGINVYVVSASRVNSSLSGWATAEYTELLEGYTAGLPTRQVSRDNSTLTEGGITYTISTIELNINDHDRHVAFATGQSNGVNVLVWVIQKSNNTPESVIEAALARALSSLSIT